MELETGWIDSWQLRDEKDVHPSHKLQVVTIESLNKVFDEISDMEFICKFGSTPNERLAIAAYIRWIKRFRMNG
jgi:hypothetical protein